MTTLAIPLPKRPSHPTGIWDWLTTIDHKKIGILYGVTAFIMFLTGGLEALYIRAQLATPEAQLVSPEVFNQLFTMHATTMIFLGVMPMGAAFFNYIIPLQIGARDVAFPRLNAFSYWTFLGGALILKLSYFLGGAPNAGWFGYSPITGIEYNPGHGIDFWILSLQVLGNRVAGGGVQLHRDDIEHAGAGHVADADAAVHVDDAGYGVPADPGVPGDYGGADRAAVRPVLRDQLLRHERGSEPAVVAAPVLDIRASRGVHPDSAGDGDRVGDIADVLQEAAVRLPGHRAFGDHHRLHGLDGVEPPHVHGRSWGRWRTRCSR